MNNLQNISFNLQKPLNWGLDQLQNQNNEVCQDYGEQDLRESQSANTRTKISEFAIKALKTFGAIFAIVFTSPAYAIGALINRLSQSSSEESTSTPELSRAHPHQEESNMTLSLENLPQALVQQHHSLCKEASGITGAEKEKTQEYFIDGLAIKVLVNMARTNYEIPKEATFCGGKTSKNTVEVTITPSDERVKDVVVSHFKSQVFPAMFIAPEMPLFNEVVIK